MEKYPVLIVKPEADIHLRNRHHAIFKAAVARVPKAEDGAIVEVRANDNSFLCYAHWNSRAYICGRAIAFREGDPLAQVREKIERAVRMRETYFRNEDTDAFRLVNAEGDGLPGLIVDRYADVLAVQLTTMGMDRLREWIGDILMEIVKPKAIFEKSSGPARKKENLESAEGWIRGDADTTFTVKERGLQYRIGLLGSQKTGLFLDQREMRSLVRKHAEGRTVLDICSYVGGFSLNALKGGALAADAVDYDGAALDRAKEHVQMNGLDASRFNTYPEDAFDFLRRTPALRPYDFIILDPPAFAKRSADLEPAKKAYTDLNRMAMQILPPGGLLLTCSCSYQMDRQLFQTTVFHAARQARKDVKIIQRHHLAYDHPVNIYHPETDYLKSLLLWVG
ncbi:MAG: class I SAM-dependent rRNA methyltransferase [Candidatus Peribacteraceae bacterium]|nr:class I SAM-dependent rRNA methyltransferase [Candidatus Peribacteraceae bacterium]